jgi:hypothetical protein
MVDRARFESATTSNYSAFGIFDDLAVEGETSTSDFNLTEAVKSAIQPALARFNL